jgi:anti-anti-sigma regulatory factor
MAKNDEKELIGFDPLAWMNDDNETDKIEEQRAVEQIAEPVIESYEPMATEELAAEPIIENMAEPEQADDFKLALDATLNIQNVTDLHEQLLVMLEQNDKIEIDASAVDSIDTATLQLLIVLKQTAIKLQKEIIFDFPSDRFVESAELLGLAEMLEIDRAAAGFF